MARRLMINGDAVISGTTSSLRDTYTTANASMATAGGEHADYSGDLQQTSSMVEITGCNKTITTHGGPIVVFGEASLYMSGGTGAMYIYVDGVSKKGLVWTSNTTSKQSYSGMVILNDIPAGTHTFSLRYRPQNGNYKAYVTNYNSSCLCVFELPTNKGNTQDLVSVPTDASIQSLINVLSSTPGNLYNFSASEQAVGLWTNGKTIYRKILTQSCPPGASTPISTGVNNIDTLLWCDAWSYAANGTWSPVPRTNQSAIGYQIALGSPDGYTQINVGVGSSFSGNVDVTLIIYYTKN